MLSVIEFLTLLAFQYTCSGTTANATLEPQRTYSNSAVVPGLRFSCGCFVRNASDKLERCDVTNDVSMQLQQSEKQLFPEHVY